MAANFSFPISDHRPYQDSASLRPHTVSHYPRNSPEYVQFAHTDALTNEADSHASGSPAPPLYTAASLLEARLNRSANVSADYSVPPTDAPGSGYQLSQLDVVSQPVSGNVARLSPISPCDSQFSEFTAAGPSSSSGYQTPEDRTSSQVAGRRSSHGKSRREKPRLELAPDQPLTTQGKPRCRVFVACLQCRSRKIRCDGTKPSCHNCSRRTDAAGPCTYDTEPKRRGPDKTPGARQRSIAAAKEDGEPRRRTRRRTVSNPPSKIPTGAKTPAQEPGPLTSRSLPSPMSLRAFSPPVMLPPIASVSQEGLGPQDEHASGSRHVGVIPTSSAGSTSASLHALPLSEAQAVEGMAYPQVSYRYANQRQYVPSGMDDPYAMQAGGSAAPPHDQAYGHRVPSKPALPAEPSSRYSRETWWDVVLGLYASPYEHPHGYPMPLPPGVRETATRYVNNDLRVLFQYSSYWLSFLNLSRLLRRLRDPAGRASLQPSFVLGALALATFLQSHEGQHGNGAQGRERALWLKNEAQSALEASLASRWINDNLVQAAWLLTFFEVCAHPLYTSERVCSSVSMLDSLIRYTSFNTIDVGDPRVTLFATRTAPVVSASPPEQRHHDPAEFYAAQHGPDAHTPSDMPAKCWCSSYTLGQMSPGVMDLAPLWSHTAGWLADWTESDIRREECRRLVWSSVILIAGYASYNMAMGKMQTTLALMDPANFAVLLPGESLLTTGAWHSKDTVWALYMRSLLLWNGCVHTRADAGMSDADKAQYAMDAWLEIDKIERALGRHTCNIERTFLFVSRDYLFISRLYLYYELQRLVPHIELNTQRLRQKADEWLMHHDSMARRTMHGLHTITGQPTSCLSGRPFYVFWFMGQITRMARMLTLWSTEHTFVIALDACKSVLAPLEYLIALWPCDEVHRRFEQVRERLVEACQLGSVAPPISQPPTAHYINGAL